MMDYSIQDVVRQVEVLESESDGSKNFFWFDVDCISCSMRACDLCIVLTFRSEIPGNAHGKSPSYEFCYAGCDYDSSIP